MRKLLGVMEVVTILIMVMAPRCEHKSKHIKIVDIKYVQFIVH